jgi:hypothetical protein
MAEERQAKRKPFLNNRRLKETPLAQAPIFNASAEKDTALAYSALQYLEALYLTRNIVLQNIARGNYNINILFLLPQDTKRNELDYYCLNPDDAAQFQQDFQVLLPVKCLSRAITTRVYFKSFACAKRPYIRYRTGKKQEPEPVLDSTRLSQLVAEGNSTSTRTTCVLSHTNSQASQPEE